MSNISKVIDINDRVPARRKKRQRRTNIKFGVLITIFVVAIIVATYLSTPISKVKEIQLDGFDLVSEEQYIEMSKIQLNQSMWTIKPDEVKKMIEQNEWVEEVVVKRKWLTTVEVTIKEYAKVAYVQNGSEFYPLLANGFVFEEELNEEAIDAPLFINFSDEKLRVKTLKQLGELKPEVLSLISQINANPSESDPYAITLFMNDGFEVRADLTTFASKLNFYPSIVAQIKAEDGYEKGIIDIEVGSYYRPYSGEYQSIYGTNEQATSASEAEVTEYEQETGAIEIEAGEESSEE